MIDISNKIPNQDSVLIRQQLNSGELNPIEGIESGW